MSARTAQASSAPTATATMYMNPPGLATNVTSRFDANARAAFATVATDAVAIGSAFCRSPNEETMLLFTAGGGGGGGGGGGAVALAHGLSEMADVRTSFLLVGVRWIAGSPRLVVLLLFLSRDRRGCFRAPQAELQVVS